MGQQFRFRRLGVETAGCHLGRDAVPGRNAGHAGLKRCRHDGQLIALALGGAAHDDRAIQHKKGRAGPPGSFLGGPDAAQDLRVGQRIEGCFALGRCKRPVRQQMAVEGAVLPDDVRPEPRRQLRQQR